MMLDVAYKWMRKTLNPSLYRGFSKSIFGRAKNYETFGTYRAIFEHYIACGLAFSGKTVLEIGPGNQFITALHFLNAGAARVLLVDPKITLDQLPEDISQFNRGANAGLSLDEARKKILCFQDMSEIPPAFDSTLDVVCSHYVLEHFNDLAGFFKHTSRLLGPSGISYNRVDVSDHTYHIFAKYKLTFGILKKRMLYHLRYSNEMFAKLNDPKCYMNRALLPAYVELAESTGLKVKEISTVPDKPTAVHRDLLSKFRKAPPEEIFISSFSLSLTK